MKLAEVFAALEKSPFRRRFRLRGKELEYLRHKGMNAVLEHAAPVYRAAVSCGTSTQRRQADADAPSSGIHRPTRNSNLLSRVFAEVARHPEGACAGC